MKPLTLVVLGASGVLGYQGLMGWARHARVTAVVVPETWVSREIDGANLDSPAFWVTQDGKARVIVSGKVDGALHVLDAGSGAILGPLGKKGLIMDRPNGLAVDGDLLFVVERDAGRVQVFRLPDMSPLGAVGEGQLIWPYGITATRSSPGTVDLFVTDDHRNASVRKDMSDVFGREVKHFRVVVGESAIDWTMVRSFGEAEGPGRLEKVESIVVDPAYRRLLVADEGDGTVKIYTLDGVFAGIVWGKDHFRADPEGIAMYPCGDEGYFILTDQDPRRSVFHVLDRRTLAYVGAFTGSVTSRTDGVALTQARVAGMQGAFFALHNDDSIGAFAWEGVAEALGLRVCGTEPPAAENAS